MRAVPVATAALYACALVGLLCSATPARAQSLWQSVGTVTTGASHTAAPRAFASAVALDSTGSVLVTGGLYVPPFVVPQASTLFPAGAVLPVTDGAAGLYGDAMRSKDGGVMWQAMNPYSADGTSFSARALHASAAFNGRVGDDRILIYGGVGYGAATSRPDTVLADTWLVTSDCAVWQRISSAGEPGPRAGHALVSLPVRTTNGGYTIGQTFLLIGGARDLSTPMADVWLSSSAGAWWYRAHDATNTFGARVGHGAAVINGVPYVMGGMGPGLTAYNDVWRATDVGCSTWELVTANAGTARVGFSAFVTGGVDMCVVSGNGAGTRTRMYDVTVQAGGHSGVSIQSAGYVTVSTPNASTPLMAGAWSSQFATLPGTLMGAAAAFSGSNFLVIGGAYDPVTWMSAVIKLPLSALVSLLPPNALNATLPSSSSSCAAGYYGGCGNTCLACPAGTFSAAGAASCTACAPGTYSWSVAAASCMACPPGSVAASAGSPTCTQCPPYFVSDLTRVMCLDNTPPDQPNTSAGLKPGAIVGITVGTVAGTALLCLAIACCVRRKPAAAAAAARAPALGGAAALGVLSTAPAGQQHVVVVYAGADAGAAAKTSAYPSVPAHPGNAQAPLQYVPLSSPGPAPGPAQPVVVVRPNGPPPSGGDANVTSWQSLFSR